MRNPTIRKNYLALRLFVIALFTLPLAFVMVRAQEIKTIRNN